LYNTTASKSDPGIAAATADRPSEPAPVTLNQRVSEFYVEQRLSLYRHLLHLGAPEGEAQELAQEAFLELYRALLSGQELENWRAWLFRVARNKALNRFKAARAREPIHTSGREIAAGDADPERQAILAQRYRQLMSAIARLSPQQRECLQLRAAGFRYREIAEILGVTLPTVGEFLRRGVIRLKKAGL
jgi:RNA polymerase sigma-70 factor (ECF subfamily)